MSISARGCREDGFGSIEVMVAVLILTCALLGTMGMYQWADFGLREGTQATRALAMAESRLEAKRMSPWSALLTDDLDADGTAEKLMRDDGTPPDKQAEDGVFTAGVEQDGIRLVWTVQGDRVDMVRLGSFARVGSVVIQATANYPTGRGQWREIQVGTLRANPNYVGPQ
jgi:hypothetical protein